MAKTKGNGSQSRGGGQQGPNVAVAGSFAVLACVLFYCHQYVLPSGSQLVLTDVTEIEASIGQQDPAFDFKGYGESVEKKMCREHVWPVLNEYVKVRNTREVRCIIHTVQLRCTVGC